MKITRIRAYQPPDTRPIFNQSEVLVTVETDDGVTGIGEGGSPDTIAQCGAMLIGEDPARIHHLWQLMYRGYFYPAGREKLHAIGALDVALWDIRGKVLGAPIYDLIGGLTRQYVECYSTGFPSRGSVEETARACIDAGFRAYRTAVTDPSDGVFDSRRMVEATIRQCEAVRAGVGADGDWAIDYHTRLDMADAMRLSSRIEHLEPLFIEDPLRSENPDALVAFRNRTRLPIAVGEQYGDRWEIHALLENHAIDYTRVSLPNVGGITEWTKIAALCETHGVGMIPHFTGPVSLTALVHVLSSFAGPVVTEVTGAGPRRPAHLPAAFDFHDGKLWPGDRPGLGVEIDVSTLPLVCEVTEHSTPIPLFRRPDGSFTNW